MKCQIEGCEQDGHQFQIEDDDVNGSDEIYYFCFDHAGQEGFCAGCGCYVPGMNLFTYWICDACFEQWEGGQN